MKLKIEIEGNDSLSIEHKEEIHIFHKSMDLLISSIDIIIYCTHMFMETSRKTMLEWVLKKEVSVRGIGLLRLRIEIIGESL